MTASSVRVEPRLLVFSSLFPSSAQPNAGLFIRERMFRVAAALPVVVVAPQPWFPLQGLIRFFRPHFRPMAPRHERMQGIDVHRPRFLCFPGMLKRTDGFLMAACSYLTVRRLVRTHRLNVLDVHFGYPDGRAGSLLKRWLGLPLVITLRGKEERLSRTTVAAPLRRAIQSADRLITVSDALRDVAIEMGADPARISVIGNGIDLAKFHSIDKAEARKILGLPLKAKIIVSVGSLVERKGFHRVIACMPELVRRHPDLHYLAVGGSGPEGDISHRLSEQTNSLGLGGRIHFVGALPPDRLKVPLSAADVFVLATSYEGWANVFLEAMACGLPVVTTRVGGNAQVVCGPELGTLVEFGDERALTDAISHAVARRWDSARISRYAQSNDWCLKIPQVVAVHRCALAEVTVRASGADKERAIASS